MNIHSVTGKLAVVLGLLPALSAPAEAHVRVITPNGGEVLSVGSVYKIEWTIAITHTLLDWDLWYSTTGPTGPWLPIVMNLPPGSAAVGSLHSYDWTVPNTPSTQVRIRARMENQGANYYDISDNDLTIAASCPTSATYCTPKAGLACGVPAISAIGSSSASATSGFFILAGPARTNKSGLLIYTNSGSNNASFQGGTLCISAPIKRSPAVNSGGTGNCDGEFGLDMSKFASGNGGGNPASYLTLPGALVHAQWWGRDSVATGSFLSDGLQYTVCP